MRPFPTLALVCGLAMLAMADSHSSYKITKVNHEFLNEKGETHVEIADFRAKAVYQKELASSEQVSGLRFIIHWQSASMESPNFAVKVEARGLDSGTQREIIQNVVQTYPHAPDYSGWTFLDIKGDSFKQLGRLMAWKVTLLQNDVPMATRKSFLWDDTIQASPKTPTP